jgi:hypothetical protein
VSERKLRQLGGEFRERLIGIKKVRVEILLFDQRFAEDAVGQSGRVPQQVLNRHFALRGLQR